MNLIWDRNRSWLSEAALKDGRSLIGVEEVGNQNFSYALRINLWQTQLHPMRISRLSVLEARGTDD